MYLAQGSAVVQVYNEGWRWQEDGKTSCFETCRCPSGLARLYSGHWTTFKTVFTNRFSQKLFLQNLYTCFSLLQFTYTLLGCQNHIISQQELYHGQNLTRYPSVVLSLDNFYLQIPFYHRINYCHYCHFENKEDKSKTLKEKE